MTNEGFREYVNGNMLFWAANVKSPEGYKGIYCVLSTYNYYTAIDHRQMVGFAPSLNLTQLFVLT